MTGFAICLPCWRQRFSMTDEPPRVLGWPEERCVLCGRRTNHGIYVSATLLKRGRRR